MPTNVAKCQSVTFMLNFKTQILLNIIIALSLLFIRVVQSNSLYTWQHIHNTDLFNIYLIIMRCGSEVKSLNGTGIFFSMYSQTTSMLYFNCAEMGMTGAPSATVPSIKCRIWKQTENEIFSLITYL